MRFATDARAVLTDAGTADLMARHLIHEGRPFIYVPNLGWLQRQGTAYQPVHLPVLTAYITQHLPRLIEEAIDREASAFLPEGELGRWLRRARSASQARNVAHLLAGRPELVVRIEETMPHPDVVPVANGELHLDPLFGEVRLERPQGVHLAATPTAWNPEASCPRFEAMVLHWCGGDEEVAAYLQRVAGTMALGGVTRYPVVVLHGPTASGKSTFLSIMRAVLGPSFVVSLSQAAVDAKDSAERRFALSPLVGARAATIPELSVEQFNAGALKALSGADTLLIERKGIDPFDYTPFATLVMTANKLPSIGDDAGRAMSERLAFIEFPNTHEHDDSLVPELLAEEAEGILRWIIEGALLFRAEGMGKKPAAVVAAVEEVADMQTRSPGTVAAFVREALVLDADARESRADLAAAYHRWCKAEGDLVPLSARQLFAGIRESAGAVDSMSNGTRYLRGVRLVPGYRAKGDETPDE